VRGRHAVNIRMADAGAAKGAGWIAATQAITAAMALAT
jgi:hypothetical protein